MVWRCKWRRALVPHQRKGPQTVAWPLEHRCLKERGGANSEMRPVARNKRAGLAEGQMQFGGGNQTIQSCAILSRLTKTRRWFSGDAGVPAELWELVWNKIGYSEPKVWRDRYRQGILRLRLPQLRCREVKAVGGRLWRWHYLSEVLGCREYYATGASSFVDISYHVTSGHGSVQPIPEGNGDTQKASIK